MPDRGAVLQARGRGRTCARHPRTNRHHSDGPHSRRLRSDALDRNTTEEKPRDERAPIRGTGFYLLAGPSPDPAELAEARRAEQLSLGTAFLAERWKMNAYPVRRRPPDRRRSPEKDCCSAGQRSSVLRRRLRRQQWMGSVGASAFSRRPSRLLVHRADREHSKPRSAQAHSRTTAHRLA